MEYQCDKDYAATAYKRAHAEKACQQNDVTSIRTDKSS